MTGEGRFPPVGERLAVVGLLTLGLSIAVMGSLTESPWTPTHLALIVALVSPLRWWRRRPRAVAAAVASVSAVIWLVTLVDWHTAVVGGIALYGLGRHVDRPSSLRWFAAILLGLVAVAAGQVLFDDAVTDWFLVPARASVVVATFWFGDAQRSRDQLLASLRERAERAEEHRRVVERQAVLDERNRISGELHDVIAHSLSVMVVQSTAATRLAPVDVDRSIEAMRAVAEVGRETMDDLRNVLGLLDRVHDDRADQDGSGSGSRSGRWAPAGPDLSPQPTLASLEPLVDRYRRAGLEVELIDEIGQGPDSPSLPGATQLAAVRIVQEGLTNVLRHAPGARAVVELSFDGSELTVSVLDDGGHLEVRSPTPGAERTPSSTPDLPGGGGRGLIGMEQRVQSLGGRLRTGRRPDSPGFAVLAVLPVAGR